MTYCMYGLWWCTLLWSFFVIHMLAVQCVLAFCSKARTVFSCHITCTTSCLLSSILHPACMCAHICCEPVPNVSMQRGSNAFLLCVEGSHLAVAHYLAPKMEDHLFDCDDAGHTALHWAAQEGQLSMVEYLVRSCGFDVNARDKVGLHCLLFVCTYCDLFWYTCCMATIDMYNCTWL